LLRRGGYVFALLGQQDYSKNYGCNFVKLLEWVDLETRTVG